MKRIMGVCPPVVTIFKEDGSFDWEANEKLADFLIEKGVNGLAYLGTSGEFSVLSLEEKKEFIHHMIRYVNHRALVLVGAGSTCLEDTVSLLRCGEEEGADAALLVNPYYSVYTDEMVEAWFHAAADSVALPIVIYNIPSHTGYCFSREVVTRLVQRHSNIVGIKETVEDPSHLFEMTKVKEIRPDFTVFCAYENQGIGALCHGAEGFINATANFAPEFTVGLFNAYRQGDFEAAQAYYRLMCQAMDMYALSKPLLLACKQAVYTRVLGKNGSERLPGIPLCEESRAQVRRVLSELGLFPV